MPSCWLFAYEGCYFVKLLKVHLPTAQRCHNSTGLGCRHWSRKCVLSLLFYYIFFSWAFIKMDKVKTNHFAERRLTLRDHCWRCCPVNSVAKLWNENQHIEKKRSKQLWVIHFCLCLKIMINISQNKTKLSHLCLLLRVVNMNATIEQRKAHSWVIFSEDTESKIDSEAVGFPELLRPPQQQMTQRNCTKDNSV